ncbi:hypothetical protein CRG98_005687 [Punica granatum]|uniref:Bet v I/Major latex protein domain-containing protein n=1 Tax=Punica granatum TaxID=22663 RepID=A0A2I0L010_PUNGR|nr:hypothetical protein CRG98_005687 [Punica granatum]
MASPEAFHGGLQKDIDLISSADQYYKLWRKEVHEILSATSQNIQAVALHEGKYSRTEQEYLLDRKTGDNNQDINRASQAPLPTRTSPRSVFPDLSILSDFLL